MQIKNIVNLTPYNVTVGGTTIHPSGRIARITDERFVEAGSALGVPLFYREHWATEIPEKESQDTLYIVRHVVRAAFPQRVDLASPESNGDGEIGLVLNFPSDHDSADGSTN